MTYYDFFVTHQETTDDGETLTVAKQAMNGNRLPTLDRYLTVLGVDDREIGDAIEKLEGLPNGLAQVTVTGRNSKIIIDQKW